MVPAGSACSLHDCARASLLDCAAMSKSSKRERQRLNREARREYEIAVYRRRRRWRWVRRLSIVLIPALVAVLVFVVFKEEKPPRAQVAAQKAGCRYVAKKPKPKDTTFEAPPALQIDATKTYVATIETNCGSFTVQLAAGEAPQTVNSFVFLAKEGFYDDVIFHRVQKDFVVQGGDPLGTGSGGPGYTLPDEPPGFGYQVGSVAMANAGPGTTGSQFYVVTTEDGAAALNQQKNQEGKFSYSTLGQVTEGFETVLKIDSLGSTNPDPSQQAPKTIVVIRRITITEQDPAATTTTAVP